MFVSLFIALVLFRLIAAGAGESFSALDLNPGGSSAAFSFSIFRACVCLALEGLWHSGWGCAQGCACRRALAMRAQMIRARAGEARNVRDLESLVVLVPSDGPFWIWNHCSLCGPSVWCA